MRGNTLKRAVMPRLPAMRLGVGNMKAPNAGSVAKMPPAIPGGHNYLKASGLTQAHIAQGHNDGGGKWIQKATSNAHGQFAAKAKKAGMSTAGYAQKKSGASGKLGKQARLAQTLMGLGRH